MEFLIKAGISKHIIKAVEKLSFHQMTEVQKEAIPKILNGQPVKIRSPTGTGKTAAFAVPLIQILSRDPYGVFAVILTPTRQLAIQINDQFKAFGAYMNIRTQTIIGGLDILRQTQDLSNKRPHIVVATPGRLANLLQQTDISSIFSNIKFLVKDQADFLQQNQQPDLQKIIKALPPCTVLQFSATLQTQLTIGKRSDLSQEMILVPQTVKDIYLLELLKKFSDTNIIVFTQSCAQAQALAAIFTELKLPVLSLHSLMSQHARSHTLQAFRSAVSGVLIATDVASRGLDLPQVRLVINHNVPRSSKTYLHRIGRTARGMNTGRAITIVTQFECKLILHIEKKLNTYLKELFSEEQMKTLEDLVVSSLGTFTKARALVLHVIFIQRLQRPSLDDSRQKKVLGKGLKRMKRF